VAFENNFQEYRRLSEQFPRTQAAFGVFLESWDASFFLNAAISSLKRVSETFSFNISGRLVAAGRNFTCTVIFSTKTRLTFFQISG